MARYSAGVLTGAGSATLPTMSLYAAAAVGGKIREVGLTNTTSTAVNQKLTRLTSTGTQGSALVEGKHDPESAAASCTAFGTHTVAPGMTSAEDLGYRAQLGAAVGAGVIWTFGDTGLRIPVVATNGIGTVPESGTGQALQAYMTWDE